MPGYPQPVGSGPNGSRTGQQPVRLHSLRAHGSTSIAWLALAEWVYSDIWARYLPLGLLRVSGSLFERGSTSASWLATRRWAYFHAMARCSRLGLLRGVARYQLLGLLGHCGSLCGTGSAVRPRLASVSWACWKSLARSPGLGLLGLSGSLVGCGSVSTAVARSVTLALLLFLGSLRCSGSTPPRWLARFRIMGLLVTHGSL